MHISKSRAHHRHLSIIGVRQSDQRFLWFQHSNSKMSLPPHKRRVKFAPKYIGVALQKDTIVLPKNTGGNEKMLKTWKSTLNPTSIIGSPKSKQSPRTMNEEDNDSGYDTGNESDDSDSDNMSTDEEEQKTDLESELETEIDEASSQANLSQISPQKNPSEASTRINSSQIDSSQPTSSQLHSSQLTSSQIRSSQQSSDEKSILPIGFSLDFTDVVFEIDFNAVMQNWTDAETKQGRRVLHLSRQYEDAVSIFQAFDLSSEVCSISCLFDPITNKHWLSIYDLQKLLAFVAATTIHDSKRRKIHRFLEAKYDLRLVSAQDPFNIAVNQIRKPPKPVARQTLPLKVVEWAKLASVLVDLFEAERACVVML